MKAEREGTRLRLEWGSEGSTLEGNLDTRHVKKEREAMLGKETT